MKWIFKELVSLAVTVIVVGGSAFVGALALMHGAGTFTALIIAAGVGNVLGYIEGRLKGGYNE